MRINVAVPEAQVSKPVLDGVLEGVTRLNEALLAEGAVPTFDEAVDRVRWKPEPPGEEHFDHAAKVLARGWGDCDDLAPWHAASLRVTGEDPDAVAVVKRSGPSRWHAIVQRGDGSIDDPSRDAGMGQKKHGVQGCGLPLMAPTMGTTVSGVYELRPQMSLRPVVRGGAVVGYEARVDMPMSGHSVVGICGPGAPPTEIAMTALHQAPVASQAIVGACRGAVRLGEESEYIDDDVLDRVDAIGQYVAGVDLEDIAEQYGEEHALAAQEVGAGFFKMLGRGLKKVALPLTKKLVQFIPGVGPIASTALDMGEGMIKSAMKGGKRRRRPAPQSPVRVVPTTAVYQPSAAECVEILRRHHGGAVAGDEVGRIKFGKFMKHAFMPHTIITDAAKKNKRRRARRRAQ